MKENTETIIAMLEELLTVSKSRQASQSGCTNMDITSIKALIEEAGRRNHERTEAELAKFAHGIVDCLNTVNNRIDRIARGEQPETFRTRSSWILLFIRLQRSKWTSTSWQTKEPCWFKVRVPPSLCLRQHRKTS